MSPRAAAATDVGLLRSGNEDAHGVGAGCWVVADGLGGLPAGEVASEVAAEAALAVLEGGGAGVDTMLACVRAAHDAVAAAARQDRARYGMATTLVAAQCGTDGVLSVVSVGDSRAYLLVDGELAPLTVDDNEAQELLALGALTPAEARVHPGQYVVTRVIDGGRSQPRPQVREWPAARGRLLLCTDGLTTELTDEEIAALLARGTPEDACAALIAEALDAGGSDNVTVVVVDLAP